MEEMPCEVSFGQEMWGVECGCFVVDWGGR